MSNKRVQVNFQINVRGMIGGSFDIDADEYAKIEKRWGKRKSSHEETDLADELLSYAPFNFFNHLNVDKMEIEELDSEELTEETK